MPVLTRTGVRELDRVVDGFNRYGTRFEKTRRACARRPAAEPDQRLAPSAA